jgi:cell division protein FtsZ
MSEIQEAAEVITGSVSPDANIIFGASIRPELGDEIVVTVVATGFDSEYRQEPVVEAQSEEEKPATSMENEKPEAEEKDFAIENKSNMWDSIKKDPEPEPATDDDAMDVPPSLRERFLGKKKKD